MNLPGSPSPAQLYKALHESTVQPLLNQRPDGARDRMERLRRASGQQARRTPVVPRRLLDMQDMQIASVSVSTPARSTVPTASKGCPQSSYMLPEETDTPRSRFMPSWISAVPRKLWRLERASRLLPACRATTPVSHHGEGQEPAALCSVQ